MLEVERKFVVEPPASLLSEPGVRIEQYYLSEVESVNEVRVRVVSSPVDGQVLSSVMTIKTKSEGGDCVRREVEFDIPVSDAFLLIKGSLRSVRKIRREIMFMGKRIEVDYYEGSSLIIAEVEYESESVAIADFSFPEWFKKEVTGLSEYSNSFLARG